MKAFATATALLASANSALGALQQVTGFGSNPTNIQMFISVPAKVATSPAIIVAVSYQIHLLRESKTKTSILASPLRRLSIPMVLRHPPPLRLRNKRLHPYLPPNHQIQQLLGRQQRSFPDPQWWRRRCRHHQHGQLHAPEIQWRQVQGFCYGRLLRRHDVQRHGRLLPGCL